jgi:predicted O-methyltransferase YrrM
MNLLPKQMSRARRMHRWHPVLTLTGALHAREILFQNMLSQNAEAAGVTLRGIYPVVGAANYSLLYVVFRSLSELPVASVMDIGAGLTSILLSAMADAFPHRAVTLESNEQWAKVIGPKIRHPLLVSALRDDGEYREQPAGTYDMVIVDGPAGAMRHSRKSALAVLQKCLAEEFLVIFDDAERKGEQDTILEFCKSHPEARTQYVMSNKAQCLVFTKKFGAAEFF